MLLTGSRSCGKGTDCAVAEGGSKSDAWPALRCPHRSSPSSVMCVPNTDLLAEAEHYLNTARPRGRRLHPRGSRSRTRARHIKPVLPRRSGPIDQGLPDRRPRPSGLGLRGEGPARSGRTPFSGLELPSQVLRPSLGVSQPARFARRRGRGVFVSPIGNGSSARSRSRCSGVGAVSVLSGSQRTRLPRLGPITAMNRGVGFPGGSYFDA
jgi:hypothetical protein